MSEVQAFGKLKALYDAMPAKDISWIAGGALRSYLVGDRVKDLDIFSAERKRNVGTNPHHGRERMR